MVALDGATLAGSVQEAAMPSTALVARLLGHPADSVHSAGVAELELFGERVLPRVR